MDRVKNFFTPNPNGDSESITNLINPLGTEPNEFNLGNYFELTLTQRMYGFGISLGIGLLFSLVGIISLFFLNFTAFGLCYSFGNICVIASTLFLIGPVRQFKNMFQLHRALATVAFLASIGLTLCSALWWNNAILCFVFLIIQICAFTWYILSYIPYGRTMCANCLGSMTGINSV